MSSSFRRVRAIAAHATQLATGRRPRLPRREAPAVSELLDARELLEQLLHAEPVVTPRAQTYLACALTALGRAIDSERHEARGDAESAALLACSNVEEAVHSFAPRELASSELGRVPCPECWNGDRALVSNCTYCRGTGRVPISR